MKRISHEYLIRLDIFRFKELQTILDILWVELFYKKRKLLHNPLCLVAQLKASSRYVIMNYENSTFSVSQCRFDKGIAKKIVAIPSASRNSTNNNSTTTPPVNGPTMISSSQLKLTSVIEIVSGSVVFLTLSVLILTFILRKRRSTRRRKKRSRAMFKSSDSSGNLEEQRVISPQEVDVDSLCGTIEIPDSGKAELQDEKQLKPELENNSRAELRERTSARNLVFQIQELPSHDHPLIRELIAAERVIRAASARLPSSRASSPRSKFSLSLPAEDRREHEMDCSEISIAHHSLRLASAGSSRQVTPNLNRSLPPTPISESPQQSQIMSATDGQLIEDILLFCYRSHTTSHGSTRTFDRL